MNVGQVTDRQMEYEAYEPIVHLAQVGSNIPIHSTFLLQAKNARPGNVHAPDIAWLSCQQLVKATPFGMG